MTDTSGQATDPETERRWIALQAKLAMVSGKLIRQGTMVRKTTTTGRVVWAIRYVDEVAARRVHKSVYIGDHPVLVDRARLLLGRCRARQRWPAEVAASARLVASTTVAARRLMSRSRARLRRGG